MKKLKEFAAKFLLEILLFIVTATATCIVGLKTASAVQESRINSIEKTLEVLRSENNSAHSQILDALLNGK